MRTPPDSARQGGGPDSSTLSRQNRKTADRALVLLILGMALLLSPVAQVFGMAPMLAGLPGALLYVFVTWAALILGTALLSAKLRDQSAEPGAAERKDWRT